MALDNLEDVITDSIDDAAIPAEPVETDVDPVEASPEPTETPETTEEPTTSEVSSPAKSEAEGKVVDEFEKKFGIPATSATGRENRIPYSRVKKITEKAVKDAETSWKKDLEKSYVPTTKYAEIETKFKDYETRLGQVAQFENLMTTNHAQFLTMLAQRIPGYAEILAPLFNPQEAAPAQPQAPVPDDMPQPDQKLSDGSMVYSMDGLKSLMQWQANQVKLQTIKEVEARYAPIEKDYRDYQQVQSVIPHVQRQIQEARTWPLFNDSEPEIVEALKNNPSWGLERAYQYVVLPKLQAQRSQEETDAKALRDKIRQEVIGELKNAPRATSIPGGGVKPTPKVSDKPRSLEAVIKAAIDANR